MRSFIRSMAIVAALGMAALLAQPVNAQVTLQLGGNLLAGCGTATGTAGASTLANKCGVITTESLTTAAGAVFTETITNTAVAAADVCFASVTSAGAGTPAISEVTPGASSLVITVQNIHAANAFNNTLAIAFFCFKP